MTAIEAVLEHPFSGRRPAQVRRAHDEHMAVHYGIPRCRRHQIRADEQPHIGRRPALVDRSLGVGLHLARARPPSSPPVAGLRLRTRHVEHGRLLEAFVGRRDGDRAVALGAHNLGDPRCQQVCRPSIGHDDPKLIGREQRRRGLQRGRRLGWGRRGWAAVVEDDGSLVVVDVVGSRRCVVVVVVATMVGRSCRRTLLVEAIAEPTTSFGTSSGRPATATPAASARSAMSPTTMTLCTRSRG